jgi:hypothetical protein
MADRILDPRLTRRANADAIDAGLSTLPRLTEQIIADSTATHARPSVSWSRSPAHRSKRTGR